MDNTNIIENQLLNHCTIRNYSDKPVSKDLIKHIVDVARHASTSEYAQLYSVINITDPELKQYIATEIAPQKHVAKAPVILAFLADVSRIARVTESKGETVPEEFYNYTEIFLTSSVDAAILAQNFAVSAESYGLGVCFIGGARNELAKLIEALKLPKGVYPVFLMTVGYPTETFKEMLRPRLPFETVYMENCYQTDGEAELLKEYDEVVKQYYIERSRGKSEMTYSDRAIEFAQKEHRPKLKETVQKQGFNLK